MALDRNEKAIRFIYNRQHFGIKLGLENITNLCNLLGNPQDQYDIVHVAGTNGKGSTSSFIASILQAAGYKVGILTSPHLADYHERIRVNGKKIPPEAITAFVERFRPHIVKTQVTFFEVTTALAFWYFAQCKVDWAVLEVGLGGRLDATNVCQPRATVITNISLEHTNLLGRTIYKIAGEKAGIVKENIPLVTGVTDNGNDAARRFREICQERRAPLYFHNPRNYHFNQNGKGDYIEILKGRFAGLKIRLGLSGRHQAANAYLAVRTIEIINEKFARVSRMAVRRGLENNHWPGRFMTIDGRPMIIVDVAHNRDGFGVLADTLRSRFPGRKFSFLISMVEKKKGDWCLHDIAPLAESISVAPLQNARRDDPYHLISRLNFNRGRVRVFPNANMAVKDLLENSDPSDILVIAGSHFVVGELTPLIKRDGF